MKAKPIHAAALLVLVLLAAISTFASAAGSAGGYAARNLQELLSAYLGKQVSFAGHTGTVHTIGADFLCVSHKLPPNGTEAVRCYSFSSIKFFALPTPARDELLIGVTD